MRFIAFFDNGSFYEFDGSPEAKGYTVAEFSAEKLLQGITRGVLELWQVDGLVTVIDFKKKKNYLIEFEAYTVPVVRENHMVGQQDGIPNYAKKYQHPKV